MTNTISYIVCSKLSRICGASTYFYVEAKICAEVSNHIWSYTCDSLYAPVHRATRPDVANGFRLLLTAINENT